MIIVNLNFVVNQILALNRTELFPKKAIKTPFVKPPEAIQHFQAFSEGTMVYY